MNKVVLERETTHDVSSAIDPNRVAVTTPSEAVVEEICNFNWDRLSSEQLVDAAWSYYYFSVQFRENLEIARALYPEDKQLEELDRGERDTDNLSPYPGVVVARERVNHDEFMRRTLQLTPIDEIRRLRLEAIGAAYLARTRAEDDLVRASSLSSYEDGGLEKVFRSILRAQHWDNALLRAFKHFLEKHIELDSDVEQGHGGLCRHLAPKERVSELWIAFKDSLVQSVPALQ